MPVFWLILCLIILLPCLAFLVLCVSPRLFDQGSQWFTLTYLQQSLTGSTAVAIVNSLWVSVVAAVIGLVLGWASIVVYVPLARAALTTIAAESTRTRENR